MKKEQSILPDPDDKEHITVHAFEDLDALIETGNVVQLSEDLSETYYHIPFWFKRAPGGSGWYVYDLNHLPKTLVNHIIKERLGGDNLLPIDIKPELKLQCPKCKEVYFASKMSSVNAYALDLMMIRAGCCNIDDLIQIDE